MIMGKKWGRGGGGGGGGGVNDLSIELVSKKREI